ncbi:MAG: HDOD domain-containing protein [Deltaproteobacteria bacterium]|nr:HDOD domain-containing protein [Deltaproteobacteria bacterium]
MAKLTPQTLISNVRDIGTLPDIYSRLTQVISKSTSSAAQIGEVVVEDPGLTARLLRIVNSAFYNFPRKIDTISRAVVIVGTDELRHLALATTVISMFNRVPEDLVNMRSFWRHSLACGLFARELAIRRRETNTERYFVAGLLHDIGKLVFYMERGESARSALELCREKGELHFRSESKIFGFSHTQVGSALLKQWNLPVRLQQAVAHHHNPALAVEYPLEAATIHVADIISNVCQLGSSGERRIPPLVPKAWDALKLEPTVLDSVIKYVKLQFDETVDIVIAR